MNAKTGRMVVAAMLVCLTLGWGTEAVAAAKTPPTTDQLDGVVLVVTLNQTQYDLATGGYSTTKVQVNWTLTKVDAVTLNIHESGSSRPDYHAHYENGILVTGTVNTSTLATESYYTRMLMYGTPSKTTGRGEYLNFDADWVWTGTMTAKQLIP